MMNIIIGTLCLLALLYVTCSKDEEEWGQVCRVMIDDKLYAYEMASWSRGVGGSCNLTMKSILGNGEEVGCVISLPAATVGCFAVGACSGVYLYQLGKRYRARSGSVTISQVSNSGLCGRFAVEVEWLGGDEHHQVEGVFSINEYRMANPEHHTSITK